jgi:hypothetical protein
MGIPVKLNAHYGERVRGNGRQPLSPPQHIEAPEREGSESELGSFARSHGLNTMIPKRMPQHTIGFDTVRKLARQLGDVEESTIHGVPSLKVRGKLLTCIPVHKSAEPRSLAVRIDFDHRAELIAAAPDVYYVTDHYVNYPTVLVRLSRIQPDALKDLLGMAWSFVTVKSSSRSVRLRLAPSESPTSASSES